MSESFPAKRLREAAYRIFYWYTQVKFYTSKIYMDPPKKSLLTQT